MSKGAPVTQPDPRYFQTRPSGTVPAGQRGRQLVRQLRTEQHRSRSQRSRATLSATWRSNTAPDRRLYDPHVTSAAAVPVDAADTSASGIDPDISVANAKIQAYRVAAVRDLPLATVDRLVAQVHDGSQHRLPRRARGRRARAQPRA